MARISLPAALSILFSRLLIPGWLLTGALFKLYYRSGQNLPKSVWENAYRLGIDLNTLLRAIVAVEIVLVGIMFFSSRFARMTAIAVMSVFCVILVIEIAGGAKSCGCLGEVTMPPWAMLLIDLPLLLGAIVFRRPARPPEASARGEASALRPWTAVFALAWVAVAVGLAFGVPDLKVIVDPPPTPPNGDGPDNGGTEPPVTPTLPAYVVARPSEWVGKSWNELELAPFVNPAPTDIGTGRRYVVFYSPTCDHCFEVLTMHFQGALPVPTTVIAIPESIQGFATEGVYEMTCDECEKLRLPVGTEYYITPPTVVALEDGIVKCAWEGEEADNPHCLIWH